MDQLWKKDSCGLYVNCFTNKPTIHWPNSKLGKNNETSKRFRLSGNEKVRTQNWLDAMTHYNASLRYAECNTENVSLVYANRSLCFLKMEMYDKCLIDIELAFKANYPNDQMGKLVERRAYCLKRVKNTSNGKGVPVLDFQADENFPGMANVVQMKWNEDFGRHFVAKENIDAGKNVIVEEAFVVMEIMVEHTNICSNCLKNSTNFIACANCTKSLFCDQRCAADNLHQITCNNIFPRTDHLAGYVSRSVLRAINIFANVANLMEFVSTVVEEKTENVPRLIADMETMYRLFLQLNIWLREGEANDSFHRGYDVFKGLMQLPEIKIKFAAENQKRFLIHLCVMHYRIVLCNSFQTNLTGGIFLLRNHFNHSCAPNILMASFENKSVAITSRRIKKGDQLFISYGEQYLKSLLRHERQQNLYNDFGFWCKCEKCENKNWPIQSFRILRDRQYQYLFNEVRPDALHQLKEDRTKCPKVKQGFLDLLIKYSHLPWSTELDVAAHFYQDLSIETTY